MPRPFAFAVSVSMLVGYPNTRKHQEALVGAYFGIYDCSRTALNKGTRAGCLGAAGLVMVCGAVYRNHQGRGSGKTGGWFRERGEIIPPHSHTPSTKHWPITRKKKGCSGLEHPFRIWGVAEKQGAPFSLSGSEIL